MSEGSVGHRVKGGGLLEKGRLSNFLSFTVLAVGLALSMIEVADGTTPDVPHWLLALTPWLLVAGVFGFAGGTTNWLAVKMLFDRVPLLYGSGVIPARFREIRSTIKQLIMSHFFGEEYLLRFLQEQGGELFPVGADLEAKLIAALESPEAETAIENQLEQLKEGPFGMMIKMAGVDMLKPLVQQFLAGLASELSPRLAQLMGAGDTLDVPKLRERVDLLLERKLEELTPETVKQMMEQVMREHLGWLIVWGNVFGGAIGLLSRALAQYWGLDGIS